MRSFVHRSYLALVFVFFSFAVFAQEKTQAYYNTHENEILPDANAAFGEGNYERTIQLCTWHYVFFGTRDAESLQKKAEQCAQLTKEMNDLYSKGNIKDAKLKASAILSLNPDDSAAKAISLIETPETPIPDMEAVMPATEPVDTVASVPKDETIINSFEDQQTDAIQSHIEDVPHITTSVDQLQSYEPHTLFVIKAGVSIIDLKQVSQSIAPSGSIGFYDIGGSHVGGEIGAYLCSGLLNSSASLFGIDASLVYRATSIIYPKVGLGFFSCKPSDGSVLSTSGMCAGAGVTFLIGGHFCLEVGAKYYPKISANGSETVSTTPGATYSFPTVIQITSNGLAPIVSVGWAF